MKPILYTVVFLVIFGCSPLKKDETATDSTQNIATDTVAAEETASPSGEETSSSSAEEPFQFSYTAETGEPFSGITENFPKFSMATLTNDSLELEITYRMGKLLQAYDTIQYTKVTSSYSWERPYCFQGQEGPCEMSVEKEEGTQTWYFDRNNQLRGFSSIKEGFSPSILYLFYNDSLVGIRERIEDGTDAGTFIDLLQMVASSCPRCGMAASTFQGEINGDLKYLNENDLAAKQKEFYESMPELISLLKAGRKKAIEDGDDFVFSVNRTKEGNEKEKSKAITYPVEFRVTKSLYPNYISKQ